MDNSRYDDSRQYSVTQSNEEGDSEGSTGMFDNHANRDSADVSTMVHSQDSSSTTIVGNTWDSLTKRPCRAVLTALAQMNSA